MVDFTWKIWVIISKTPRLSFHEELNVHSLFFIESYSNCCNQKFISLKYMIATKARQTKGSRVLEYFGAWLANGGTNRFKKQVYCWKKKRKKNRNVHHPRAISNSRRLKTRTRDLCVFPGPRTPLLCLLTPTRECVYCRRLCAIVPPMEYF